MEEKKFIVLDAMNNPIARPSNEVNPYVWYSLIEACKFAEEEKKNQEVVIIAELRVLDSQKGRK